MRNEPSSGWMGTGPGALCTQLCTLSWYLEDRESCETESLLIWEGNCVCGVLALVCSGERWACICSYWYLKLHMCWMIHWVTQKMYFTHSLYAICKIFPTAYHMVYLGGWQHAMCDSRAYIGSSGGGIWAFLFPLSKLPELVDTAFIVLRKQKMVFLHWYHHITGECSACNQEKVNTKNQGWGMCVCQWSHCSHYPNPKCSYGLWHLN